jgi:hypothetical protein
MSTLHSIVVIVHLIGFATLFGGWIVEAFGKRRITKVMQWGLVIALVAGLALSAPWDLGYEPNYMKIGIKLLVVIVIGALLGIGGARQKRNGVVPAGLFWPIGILTVLNVCLALLWH